MNVTCPHCNGEIIITELNCGIFRHCLFKDTGKQLNPHSSKEICDLVIKENLVYGCAKPFKINNGIIEKCDYI
jgi:hypothetical protein